MTVMIDLTLQQKLACPFPPSAVSWRVGRKVDNGQSAVVLAYVDARDVMDRLDRACGFGGWQCRYNIADNGLLICEIGIWIDGGWLWRANGAGDTQIEAEKGKCSDAFKRAAVMFGVARYLYDLPAPKVPLDQYGHFEKPALPEWATPGHYMAMLEEKAKEKVTV